MHRLFVALAALGFVAGGLAPAAVFAAPGGQDRELPRSLQRGQPRSDQETARAETLAGRNMPIAEIERRIIPRMGDAEYLGFEYDRAASAYRLKFIEGGQVVWVDVDAKTASILRISR